MILTTKVAESLTPLPPVAKASVMRDGVGFGFGADWAAGSYFLEADASHVRGGGGLDFWGKTPYVSCRA